MRLFIVGVGGCGGKISENFLENQDLTPLGLSIGGYNAFGGVKGIWIEADVQETVSQRFFLPEIMQRKDYYKPFYIIPHNSISSESITSKLMQEKYGYDLKKQGFFRQAEYLKAIFEIFDSDQEIKNKAIDEYGFENPILRKTWTTIRPYTTLIEAKPNEGLSQIDILTSSTSKKPGNLLSHFRDYIYRSLTMLQEINPFLCDGILFIVSLGGGTGTGFINPITKYIHYERSEFPIFLLGILTEEGWDTQQSAIESKRNLAAVISLHDLLTRRRAQGIDGLILIDNQILLEKFNGNYNKINKFIYQSMKPFIADQCYPGENPPSLAIRQQFLEGLSKPPILIPCYGSTRNSPVESLVEKALEDGKLFGCDLIKSDRAYIFSRGLIESHKLREVAAERIGLPQDKIHIWRRIGCKSDNEVLIFLRNPYGTPDAFKKRNTFENRIYNIINNAIVYLDRYRDEVILPGRPEMTNEALEIYFFGQKGLKKKLEEARLKIELGRKPVFDSDLAIFGHSDSYYQANIDELKNLSYDEYRIREIIEAILIEKGLLRN